MTSKFIKPHILRNILFSIAGLIVISLIISASIKQIINYRVNEKATNVKESFERIKDELEFNGADSKLKELADQYNKLFNGFCNVIVTDEGGNIVYKSNEGFVPMDGRFHAIVNPNEDRQFGYFGSDFACIVDGNNSIKYIARLYQSNNTDRLREISASNPLAEALFTQTAKNNYDEMTVKNADGTSYTISNNTNIWLSYAYIGSKGFNLFTINSSDSIRESTYAEYRNLENIFNILIGGYDGPPVVFLLFMLFWLLLPIWVFQDARKREFRAPLWAILTLAANIVGLIIYLVVRPEYPKCVSCGEQLNNRFIVCPYCGTKNKELCPNCKQVVEENWVACPYCGHMEEKADIAACDPCIGTDIPT